MVPDPSWFDRSELERLTADTTWRPSSRAPARARTEPASTPPAFVAPRGALELRLSHLLAWAASVTGLEHAFVADERGLVLAEQGQGELDPAIAAAVDRFVTGLSAFVDGEPSGHVALQSRAGFIVLGWSQGPQGRCVLALAGRSAPRAEALPELSLALADALTE